MNRTNIPHSFARRVFLFAGIYGVAVLIPCYFLEDRIGRDLPPPLTHVEYYYGFIGVALAWQFAFLVISRDVIRYRLLMLPAAAAKLLFVTAVMTLFAQGRVAMSTVALTAVDFLLALLFLSAFYVTRPAAERSPLSDSSPN